MAKRPEPQIEEFLHRLNTADAGAAWAEFIDRHSPVIMNVVRQFEFEQDRAYDCFLFVCERLSERQFRRLQRCNVTGGASFSNWLGTVVFNLCVDWHRAQFGRATLLPAIAALPAFDQLVYHHCYEQDMGRDACYQAIRADFPELTVAHVSASLGRIHALLTPRQRWRLSMRRLRRDQTGGNVASPEDFVPEPGPGPESRAQSEQEAVALRTAMQRLTADQRLLLYLRFQEGLSFQRIAAIERLGDAHRARRHVQAALDALYLALQRTSTG